MESREVRVIRPDQLTLPPGAQTPGMVRQEAASAEGVWVGFVTTATRMLSGWHHHGDYQTFAYVVSGRARIEFGPRGEQTAEAGPGDFLHIPSHIVHRESNPAEEEQQVVLFRVGTGTSLINVDGPSAE